MPEPHYTPRRFYDDHKDKIAPSKTLVAYVTFKQRYHKMTSPHTNMLMQLGGIYTLDATDRMLFSIPESKAEGFIRLMEK